MKKAPQKMIKSALITLFIVVLGFSGCSLIIDSESLIIPCGSNAECVDELGSVFYCASGACVPKGDDAGTNTGTQDAGNTNRTDAGQ